MDTAAVRRAQEKLELRDIVLHTNEFSRRGKIDPLLYPTKINQRSRIRVSTDRISFIDVDEKSIQIIRALVSLRVSGYCFDDRRKSLFSIRSTYRVDYIEERELTETELDAFTQFNAVHNVWPFWRQHVYEIVSRAELPKIIIPLFRSISGAPRSKRSARRPIERKS